MVVVVVVFFSFVYALARMVQEYRRAGNQMVVKRSSRSCSSVSSCLRDSARIESLPPRVQTHSPSVRRPGTRSFGVPRSLSTMSVRRSRGNSHDSDDGERSATKPPTAVFDIGDVSDAVMSARSQGISSTDLRQVVAEQVVAGVLPQASAQIVGNGSIIESDWQIRNVMNVRPEVTDKQVQERLMLCDKPRRVVSIHAVPAPSGTQVGERKLGPQRASKPWLCCPTVYK